MFSSHLLCKTTEKRHSDEQISWKKVNVHISSQKTFDLQHQHKGIIKISTQTVKHQIIKTICIMTLIAKSKNSCIALIRQYYCFNWSFFPYL